MLANLLQVAIGGAIGSVLRYLSLLAVAPPWGTMAVNVLGCLAMGFLAGPMVRLGLAPLVLAGVLGGFTTFSAFSLDTARLWAGGAVGQAVVYVAGSVILSLAAVGLGGWLFQAIQQRWAS